MEINVEELIKRLRASGSIMPDAKPITFKDGINCEKCGNTGSIFFTENGIKYMVACSCMKKRQSIKRIKKSGLVDALEEYTFDAFTTPTAEYRAVKNRAKEYASESSGKWFYICGKPGTGKTHICTAICSKLIESGNDVKYVIWRDIARKLKAAINDEEYDNIMEELKRVDVLYIDDFLKGTVTEPDINRAFELINARYNAFKKKTIISTERDIRYIESLDPAISGRISQRSRGYCIKVDGKNWRS